MGQRRRRHPKVSQPEPASDQALGHLGHMGHRSEGDQLTRTLADAYCCPDCYSDAELTRDDLGIWHLAIRHDTTCPTYRRMR